MLACDLRPSSQRPSQLRNDGPAALLSLASCNPLPGPVTWSGDADRAYLGWEGIPLFQQSLATQPHLIAAALVAAEREQGMEPVAAVGQACLRSRPIMMTTAAMLGGLPLILAGGSGTELRRPLGMAMVGGLAVSQILPLSTTPVVYLAFERLSRRWRGRKARRKK